MSEPDHEADRQWACEWAQGLLASPTTWVCLDTETTGLGPDAEVVSVAIVSPDGTVLLNQLVRPTRPVPAQATAVHGITDEMLALQPTFAEIRDELDRLLAGKTVVCYNADYDSHILAQSAAIHRVPLLNPTWQCAMLRYAEYVGEWNPRYGSYRWQKLPMHEGAHNALADCRATLEVIREMAGDVDR